MANKTSLAVRNAAQQEDRAGRGIRAARRTMMYIVRTMLLVVVGVLVCVLAFFTAERMANLYILATEGMSLRAAYILDQDAEMSELEEYFMLTFLAEDDALTADVYADYKISSYDYDLAIEKISVLPWTATATVTVVETVSVKGTFDKEKLQEGETADDHPLPDWPARRYRMQFVNTGVRWYIAGLELVEENPLVEPLRTPDPNRSPRPMATPTPTPALTPTPVPNIEVVP